MKNSIELIVLKEIEKLEKEIFGKVLTPEFLSPEVFAEISKEEENI